MSTNQLFGESMFKRVVWLYGAYMLLNNAAYLVGYYLLPPGLMRNSPQTAAGELPLRRAPLTRSWP